MSTNQMSLQAIAGSGAVDTGDNGFSETAGSAFKFSSIAI
jgi:hypothetical protein